jgi:hypothetical protein
LTLLLASTFVGWCSSRSPRSLLSGSVSTNHQTLDKFIFPGGRLLVGQQPLGSLPVYFVKLPTDGGRVVKLGFGLPSDLLRSRYRPA